MDYLPRTREVFKALGKNNGKLKSKKSLRSGQGHAAFNQDLFNAITQVRFIAIIFFLAGKLRPDLLFSVGLSPDSRPAKPHGDSKGSCR